MRIKDWHSAVSAVTDYFEGFEGNSRGPGPLSRGLFRMLPLLSDLRVRIRKTYHKVFIFREDIF